MTGGESEQAEEAASVGGEGNRRTAKTAATGAATRVLYVGVCVCVCRSFGCSLFIHLFVALCAVGLRPEARLQTAHTRMYTSVCVCVAVCN